MSPGQITAIVALIMGVITPALQSVGFLEPFPDAVQFIQKGAEYLLMGIFAFVAAFLSNNAKWEKIFRVVPAVIEYIRATQLGSSTTEMRKDAITKVYQVIPEGKLGWRGWVMKFPFVGEWIVGTLLDRMASGVKIVSQNTGSAAIKTARDKNNKPQSSSGG